MNLRPNLSNIMIATNLEDSKVSQTKIRITKLIVAISLVKAINRIRITLN